MSISPVQKLTLKLVFGAIGMFVFAIFVMPPIYNVFCEITGLGGKTGGPYVVEEAGLDTSRTIRVQFVTTNNAEMPWDFEPKVHEISVHPGEAVNVAFYAKNNTARDMVAQAIPSVTPLSAAQYFNKTECFCFNKQPLAAGENADLPLVFIVDRGLPKAVNTITLSYTLFDITDRFGSDVALLNQ